MIREVHEARVRTEFVKARSVKTIPDMARRHARVQHEDSRRSPASREWKKIGTRDVVRGKICIDRAGPCDCSASPSAGYSRNFSTVWNGVKLLGGERLARRHIALHFLTTARVQMMTRLKQIYRRAHEQIDAARSKTPQSVPVGFSTKHTKITKRNRGFLNRLFFVSFVILVVDDMVRFLMHSLFWWMRKIVRCERKLFAQLRVQNFERAGQFVLDACARGRFSEIGKMRNRIAEGDPDRRAP